MPTPLVHIRRSVGALTAALLLPLGAAAQNDHAPMAGTPQEATLQDMAARMQAMQQMMHEMHQMMMSMHGEQGQAMQGGGQGMMHGQQGQAMGGGQGMMGGGQGMMGGQGQGMMGRGMGMGGGMGAGGVQACSAPTDVRLAMLLAGPVGQLALSSTQWTDLVAVLEHAQTEALSKLTPEQRARLEEARAACPQAGTQAPGAN